MARHTSAIPLLFFVLVAEVVVVLDVSIQRSSQRASAPLTPIIRSHAVVSRPPESAANAAPCPAPRPSPRKVVVVEAIVDERGQVESACVVLSVSPTFDTRALAFVRDHQYEPAIHNGKPIKVFLNVSVFEHPR